MIFSTLPSSQHMFLSFFFFWGGEGYLNQSVVFYFILENWKPFVNFLNYIFKLHEIRDRT